MRLLVTGGAGYIGSHTVLALLEAGHDVAVVDDLSGGHRESLPAEVRLHVLPLAEAAATIAAERPDAVVHFAGAIEAGLSATEPRRFYRANVTATLALADALLDVADPGSPPAPLVYSSSAAVYGTPEVTPIPEAAPLQPVSVYGQTKLATEEALAAYTRAYGLRATALRYFNAAGAHRAGGLGEAHRRETHLIPLALAAAASGHPVTVYGADYPTPDGTCIRDYVHVDDLAAAHVLAVAALLEGAPGGVYNVGVGQGFSVTEVLDTVASVTGVAVARTVAPRREGDPAVLVADASRITAELGWRPEVRDLATMVRSAWAFACGPGALPGAAGGAGGVGEHRGQR